MSDISGQFRADQGRAPRRSPGLFCQVFVACAIAVIGTVAGMWLAATGWGPGALLPGGLCGAAVGAVCGLVIPPALARLALYVTPDEPPDNRRLAVAGCCIGIYAASLMLPTAAPF